MLLKSNVNVIGKNVQNYVDANGMSKKLYVVNIYQDNGKIIDSLRVSEEQFALLEPGKEFVLEMTSGNGRNGLFLKTTAVYPAK